MILLITLNLYEFIIYNNQIKSFAAMDIEQHKSDHSKQIVFPYIYGSLAFSLGKKGDSYTHRWICYVRGVNNQDLSYLIKKVVFQLHSSFQNPIKQITKPPFEIQQVGWGEFQILIQIHFNHPTMPHVEVPHMLRLHHTHTSGSQQSKKPLCSECYDQIVFTQNDPYLQQIIEAKKNNQNIEIQLQNQISMDQNQGGFQPDQPLRSITQYTNYLSITSAADSNDHKTKLEDALRFIKGEISNLQQKMRIADLDIQKVYEQIYSKTS